MPIAARPRLRPAVLALLATSLLATALTPAQAAPRMQGWDFESDAVGALPAGCETPAGHDPAAVTDDAAHTGAQALDLDDATPDSLTGVWCPTGVLDGADVQLAVHPEELADGLVVSLTGAFEGIDRPDTPVFQVWVKPDGSVFWFDGLVQDALGWTQIGAAGTVPPGRWSTLAVQVPRDLGRALVHVADSAEGSTELGDDTYVGAAGPVGVTAVSEVSGVQLATAHTGAGVDRVLVDDVTVADGRGVLRPPRDPGFLVGQRTVIDSVTDDFMQMPNSSTTLDLPGGGQEVLLTYPVHGDATQDTGTAMASSTDGGRTWSDVSERNPFPDEQSFYLTALRDGTLLAVSYHTFMTAGTDEHQAAVPTATSSDGGRSWTHREGRMTAPERMRPISDVTSRPGSPLGGFVLVHSVLEGPDGTLYQSGYGYYAEDERYRSIVMASTDGGVSWDVRSTIAVDPDLSDHPRYEGFGEAALAFASDGTLVAVMRTGNYQPLYLARSADDGRTWGEPDVVTSGPNQIPVTGVFPDLKLMDNGVLVLWVGRPGQFLLASADGTGEDWSTPVMADYLNSGNGTLTPVGRNKLLVFGDRGADWTPNTNHRKEVWVAPVVVRPHAR